MKTTHYQADRSININQSQFNKKGLLNINTNIDIFRNDKQIKSPVQSISKDTQKVY